MQFNDNNKNRGAHGDSLRMLGEVSSSNKNSSGNDRRECQEAYKNGFRQGYTEGLGDRASELLDGAIRWHKRFPKEDVSHCFVVYQEDDGATRVYLARFYAPMKGFMVDGRWGDIDEGDPRFVMWGEYRPVEFTSPGMDG